MGEPESFEVAGWLLWAVPLASLAVVAYLLISYRRHRGRTHRLAKLAARHGLRFHVTDPAGIAGLRFDTFASAAGVRVSNVVSRDLPGGEVARAFDYSLLVPRDDRNSRRRVGGWHLGASRGLSHPRHRGRSGSSHQPRLVPLRARSGAVVKLPAFVPTLTVRPAGLATRMVHKAGLPDISFESEAFNRAYDVRCADTRFAWLFLDAPMIDLLLDLEGQVGLETFGNYVLLTARLLPPESLVALAGVAARIPEVLSPLVVDEYPAASAFEDQ